MNVRPLPFNTFIFVNPQRFKDIIRNGINPNAINKFV